MSKVDTDASSASLDICNDFAKEGEPMRILMRGGKAPHDVVSAEASLARNRSGVFGANVGNLLFTNSVYQMINVPDAEVVVDSLETESPRVNDDYISRINSEFDMYVVPLANAFRQQFIPWLDRLAHVIERLTIPVVVVGVGAQLSYSGDYSNVSDKLRASTQRFMSAVLERSAKVGVRGDITASFLQDLGFGQEHVCVIGCPSMYVHGPNLRVVKTAGQLQTNDKIGINVTPTVAGAGAMLENMMRNFPDSVYIPQEHRELALLLWGQSVSGTMDPGIPADITHRIYRQDRIRFFLDPSRWHDYLGECKFALGNRIHGNIAALVAGTPAVLLSHDSRTLELAQYHKIPYQPVPKDVADVNPHELYSWADFDALNSRSPENFSRYAHFLEENDIAHIYQSGLENPEYARQLATTDFPGPVKTLFATDRDVLISRFQWLWQGIDADQRRTKGAYEPPFQPVASSVNKMTLLQAELAALKEKIEQQENTLSYLRLPAERRLIEGFRTRVRRLFKRR